MALNAPADHDTFNPAGVPGAVTPPIPWRDIAPWAVLGALLAALMLYFVSTEQGAVAVFDGMYVHEYVHDGRHLLGFPCH